MMSANSINYFRQYFISMKKKCFKYSKFNFIKDVKLKLGLFIFLFLFFKFFYIHLVVFSLVHHIIINFLAEILNFNYSINLTFLIILMCQHLIADFFNFHSYFATIFIFVKFIFITEFDFINYHSFFVEIIFVKFIIVIIIELLRQKNFAIELLIITIKVNYMNVCHCCSSLFQFNLMN
jgi:hypothetical protein